MPPRLPALPSCRRQLDSGVVGVDLSLQLSLLGLVVALLQLAEQRAVGLAQLVTGSLQGLDFLQALAVLGVLLDDFVNEGELCILKLLLDVFLDRIRVVADKFDVKHDNSPYTLLLAQGAFPAVPFKGGVPRLVRISNNFSAQAPLFKRAVERQRD